VEEINYDHSYNPKAWERQNTAIIIQANKLTYLSIQVIWKSAAATHQPTPQNTQHTPIALIWFSGKTRSHWTG